MKTESVNGNLPIEDGNYLGKWEGFRVSMDFDGFEISFLVQNKLRVRNNRSGAVTCKIWITGGIALVEAK